MSISRKYRSGTWLHICQKTKDGGILFYNGRDALILFTIICSKAIKYKISIIAVCIMLNHFHLEIKAPSGKLISSYMNSITSIFARSSNRHYDQSGCVFKKPFRSVSKCSDKKAKECFIYIGNNAKEKKAVSRCEEYRWNFLKYLDNDHPFSEPLDTKKCSAELMSLINKAKALQSNGDWIPFSFFDEKYENLSQSEKEQLADCIITLYNVIDEATIVNAYGSYSGICTTINTVSGAEYGMSDDQSEEDYRHYYMMNQICEEQGHDLKHEKPVNFDEKEKKRLSILFRNKANASPYEIAKYFHKLPLPSHFPGSTFYRG